MKNTFGGSVSVTLFGESHGEMIGAVLDGMAPGVPVDEDKIRARLAVRRPEAEIGSGRREEDAFRIVSGVKDGFTTGTPLAVLIPNTDARRGDYAPLAGIARPSHADYTAYVKYHGFADPSGGGHFSGRLTAPLVAVGTIAAEALRARGITVVTHLSELAGIRDRGFLDPETDLGIIENDPFPVFDPRARDAMRAAVSRAKEEGDSVGGILETEVIGLPVGIGEPWFDTVEGVLSHAIFSVPAVKGVEFGDGFALAGMRGSEANDPFSVRDGQVMTKTNHSGGIAGGITNGMPIVFRTAVKPTPSIGVEQTALDLQNKREVPMQIGGRHDPAVAPRARAAIDAVTALVLCDLLAGRFGTDWLSPKA